MPDDLLTQWLMALADQGLTISLLQDSILGGGEVVGCPQQGAYFAAEVAIANAKRASDAYESSADDPAAWAFEKVGA